MDYFLSKIKKLEMDNIPDRIMLLSYGFFLGYLLGSVKYFGFFKMRNFKNAYTNMIRTIHNLETKTFYINENISEYTVNNFKKFLFDVGPNETIDIVIETNGGYFTCAQMLSDLILSHEGITNAIVLNNAFSAGSLIALSCKNLYMHKNAHLSPVDVQQGNFFSTIQLSSIQKVIDNKSKDKIQDNTFLLADQAEKCKLLLEYLFQKIIVPKYDEKTSQLIKEELFEGNKNIHGTSFSYKELKDIGVDIKDITPSMISKAKTKIIVPSSNSIFTIEE